MARKLRLRIDLVNLLEEDSPELRKAIIPLLSRESVKRGFGRNIIEEIKKRTLSDKDKNGSSFTGYSKAYMASREFRIFGKSRFTVNLKLSGEMQADMRVTGTGNTSVDIGFPIPEQNNKAVGHVDGVRRLPVRDFFGLPRDEQSKILKQTIRELNIKEEAKETSDIFATLGGIAVAGALISQARSDGEPELAETLALADSLTEEEAFGGGLQ